MHEPLLQWHDLSIEGMQMEVQLYLYKIQRMGNRLYHSESYNLKASVDNLESFLKFGW